MKIKNREHLLEVAETGDNTVFIHPNYGKCFGVIRTRYFSTDILIEGNRNFIIENNSDFERFFKDFHIYKKDIKETKDIMINYNGKEYNISLQQAMDIGLLI